MALKSNTMIDQFIALVLWAVLGTALGIAGVLVSSLLPVVVLGWMFAAVGALVHTVLLAFSKRLRVWVFGSIVTVLAGAATVIFAPQPVWTWALSCYFIFSTAIYYWLQRFLGATSCQEAESA